MGFFKLRKKKKKAGIETKDVNTIIQQELVPYMKREEVLEYLRKMEKDKKKKELWDSLSVRKKVAILKYVARKKGEKSG